MKKFVYLNNHLLKILQKLLKILLMKQFLQLEKKYEQALAEKHQLEKDIRTYEQR